MAQYASRLKVTDNISTEMIIPERYTLDDNLFEGKGAYIFKDMDPGFQTRIGDESVLVAGKNFGQGNVTEQAVMALKSAGVKAVLAQSFSEFFYRSAMNLGFYLVECETRFIDDMEELTLDMENNVIVNETRWINLEIKPLPKVVKKFMVAGGLLECYKTNRNFGEFVQ